VQYSKLGKHTVNAVRLAEVLQVMARHGFADLLGRVGFHDGLPARILQGLKLKNAPQGEASTFGQRLGAAFMDLGPSFVKFGQILGTRPDLVGHRIAEDLTHLQDKVATLPFETMAEVLQADLGDSADNLFASFDTTPIASASLSQVYRATLKSGEQVVVKIQRPKAEKTIESDLSLMEQIADWVADHVTDTKGLDPVGIVEEFARSIRRELDFKIEARVIEQFRLNFDDSDAVFVPQVYEKFSARRILTMDWVDGVRVDQLDAYSDRNCTPHTIAMVGCDALCRMVFEHRFFHADPHPGNIFITRDNQLAFLDLGMAGHIEQGDVDTIADLVLALFQQDSTECVNAILALTPRSNLEQRDALEHAIAEFIAFEAQAIIGGGQVAKGIEQAVQILRRFDLELAPRFSLLLKALGTIEVVGRKIDPTIDMLPIIRPYVEEIITARYMPLNILKQTQRQTKGLLQLGRQLPGDFSYLVRQLRRGKLKFQIHHEHLENLAATIDRSSSRITAGMIVGSVIVGSSLLIRADSFLLWLGVAGYVFAGVLGLGLVISILRSNKF
jgi:ubiquinone biosynthesis protein